jgi:hypothetical protein
LSYSLWDFQTFLVIKKGMEVARNSRRLHDEELHNLHTSPNIIRSHQSKEDVTGRACSTHGRDEKYTQNFFGKTEWLRTRGRPRRLWEDNIRTDIREIRWHLAQDRVQWWAVVNKVMNLRVP